jgi:predicted dehydrogenase
MRAILVGCGHMSTVWMSLLRERSVDLVAFVDTEPGRAAAAARRASADPARARPGPEAVAFDDLDAALHAFRPPGTRLLVNLTPADAHARVIRLAIEAGFDVFTEKPLAHEAADAAFLADLARKAGRSLSVMQNRRYEPEFGPLREFSAALAGPMHVSCDLFVPWIYGGYRDAMAHPLLDDMLIHSVDQARCLIAAEPDWAFCTESVIDGSWMTGAATITATFGFRDGSVLSYRGSWCAAGRQTSWNGEWTIRARGCSVYWDGSSPALVEWSELDESGRPVAPGRREVLAVSTSGDGHGLALDEMLAALRAGRPSQTCASANLPSVAMVSAARASARQRRVVAISEVLADPEYAP